jgi:hypothetical protein
MSKDQPAEKGNLPQPGTKPWVDQILLTLPRYASVRDLLEAFGGKDRLLDAYSQGWLTPDTEDALEHNTTKLLCWLQARTLRVLREDGPL